MNFGLTDEQEAIRRTVAELATARLGDGRRRELMDGGRRDDALWEELVALGFADLAIPASCGGQGLGTLEVGLVCEELGRALAPVPFLAHCAAAVVLAEAPAGGLLARLAGGRARGAVAVLDDDGVDALAPDAADADLLVVVDGARASIADARVETAPVETIDLLRPHARVSGAGAPLEGDARRGLDRLQIMVAAELVGVAQAALDMAVDYAGRRRQFGRLIGSFQGVSHRCAAVAVDVEAARCSWRYAAWTADHCRDELPLAAAVSRVAAAAAALAATSASLQVHGGIGFTWEHPLHPYLRRARVAAGVLAPPRSPLATIAALR